MGVYWKAAIVAAIENDGYDEENEDLMDFVECECIKIFGGQLLGIPLTHYPSSKGGGSKLLSPNILDKFLPKFIAAEDKFKEHFPDSEVTLQLICDHDAW